jgi:hypothetical protein
MALARLDTVARLLAECVSIDEVRQIRDQAEAIRNYARAAGLSLEVQNRAAAVKVRAERRIGELLAETPRNAGGRPAENLSHAVTGSPTLAELGLSRMQASRYQAIAAVPEPVLQRYLDERSAAAQGREITSAGAIELGRPVVQAERERHRQERLDEQLEVLRSRQVDDGFNAIRQADARALPWPDGVADVILTSPPYGTGLPYRGAADVEPAVYETFAETVAGELYRIAHPDHGRALLVVPLDTSWLPVSPIWTMALRRAGFCHRSAVAIHDRDAGLGRQRGSVDSAAAIAVCAPLEVVVVGYRSRWSRQGRQGDSDLPHESWLKLAGPRLWTTVGDHDEAHSAPFSARRVRDLLRVFSLLDDLVVDPFVGRGTTPAECVRLGRRYLASDLSADYVALARERVRVASGDTPAPADHSSAP